MSLPPGAPNRFYTSGPELAEDLGSALLGIVPPGVADLSRAAPPGAVHQGIAEMLTAPRKGEPFEIVMIGGVPGDAERAPFTWTLAQALAAGDRRVLVVDADLGISGGLGPVHGFAELVRSGATLDGLLRKTDHPQIDLLPPGATPLSAVERCEADELAGAFRALRSAADIVLVGAPILSRSGKASRFVTFADAVLLVVRLDLDTKDVVRRTFLQLWGVEAPLLGLVAVEPERPVWIEPSAPAPPRAGERTSAAREETADIFEGTLERRALDRKTRRAERASEAARRERAAAPAGEHGEPDDAAETREAAAPAGATHEAAAPAGAIDSAEGAAAARADEVPGAAADVSETSARAGRAPVPPLPVPPEMPVWPPPSSHRWIRSKLWGAIAAALAIAAAGFIVIPMLIRGPEEPSAPQAARTQPAARAPANGAPGATTPSGATTTPSGALGTEPAGARGTEPVPGTAPAGDEPAEDEPAAAEQTREEPGEQPGEQPGGEESPPESPFETSGPGEGEAAAVAEPPPLPPESAIAGESSYTLQVAAFPSEAEAGTERTRLSTTGYEISVVRAELGAKGTWYRVFLGRFASEEEARRASEAIRARGLIKEALVRRLD